MKLSKRLTALAVTAMMLVGCFAVLASAETYTYSFDKVGELQTVVEDVTYQRYSITSGVNGSTVDAVALEFDPKDGFIPMAFMGYAGSSARLAGHTEIAEKKYGYDVVASINGSFFSMDSGTTGGRGAYGTLVDYIIANGKVMSAHAGDACEVVAFAEDGTFEVVNSCIDYALYINGEGVGSLYYVNKTSGTNEKDKAGNPVANYWTSGFYYFDTACGKVTDTNTTVPGYSVLCEKVDNTDLIVGGTLKGRVISVTEGSDPTQVSEDYYDNSNKFVIFVRSSSLNAKYVKDLTEGDEINISVTETVEASREIIENANSVIENVGWLVRDGEDLTLGDYELDSNGNVVYGSDGKPKEHTIGTHSVKLKARWTAFGVKEDGSYVFFTTDSVSTDAYQTGTTPSVTLRDVAKAMISLGCVDVIRMDGGGSTAMHVENLDGSGEAGYTMENKDYNRPTADAILVVRKSSLENEELNNALKTTVEKAGEAAETAIAEAVAAANAYFDENEYHVSGTVRRLLMKLQSAMSGKDELKALIASASGVKYQDYSFEALEELRAAYATAQKVFGDAEATSEQVAAATEALRYWLARSGSQDLPLSLGKSYTVSLTGGAANYTNFNSAMVDDLKRLTDGKADSLEGTSPEYSAWQGAPEIVLDLGEVTAIDKFIVHAARMLDWGISTPRVITVSVSSDGEKFTEVKKLEAEATTVEGKYTTEIGEQVGSSGALSWTAFRIEIEPEKTVNGRYVKFNFAIQGPFLWLTELEAVRSVDVVSDAIYITGFNKFIYSNDCSLFDSAVGNLKENDGAVNAKWTQNVFLKWSEEDGCYIVTANSFGNGSAPNRTLGEGELLLAVHGDTGDVGYANRTAASKLKVGDKVGIYGVDVENAKLGLAPFAKKIEEVVPEDPYGPGDVDGDGKIGAKDYAMVKRHVLKTFTLTEEQIARADVDGDDKIGAKDYAMIKRHVLGTFDIPGAKGKR